MMETIPAIFIPDATLEPAAYVRALQDTLGEQDALTVYAGTATRARQLCCDLTDEQWRTPMADGEWSALQIVGHLLDADVVYGFRWRLVLTEEHPSYPGYDEKLWSELPRPGPAQLLDALYHLRGANVALLGGTDSSGWQRRGVHGEQGDEPFDLMVSKIAGHDLAHLNQLERTVAAATSNLTRNAYSEVVFTATERPQKHSEKE